MQGKVYGGSQPIKNASVKLYAASQTAYAGSAALLTTTSSDGSGNFTITGTYTCPANSLVYITATGGDPGIGSNNPQIALASTLGSCSGTLSSSLFININEVSTVATAYALAGFSTDLTHIGTSATNVVGLSNAMQTFNNLVNVGTGAALTITPAYAAASVVGSNTSVVPQAQINTLADILAGCVNSTGGTAPGGASDGTNCGNLFAAVPGTTPTDTFQAALGIAHRPGTNVAAIYTTLPPGLGSPFQPTVSSQPNDFTIAVTYIGGGLGETTNSNRSKATDLKVDASGNIWMAANFSGRIIELSNLGAPLSTSTTAAGAGGYSGGGLVSPSQIAIDLEGDAWVCQASGSIAAVGPTGTPLAGSPYTDSSLPGTNGISIDGSDNVWTSSSSNNVVGKYSHAGALLSGTGYVTQINSPNGGLANDNAGNIYVVNGNNTLTELNNTGGFVGNGSPGAALNGPINRLIVDNAGNEYAPQSDNSILKATGVASLGNNGSKLTSSSIVTPTAIAQDGSGNLWVAVQGQGSVTANVTELSSTGQTLSTPSKGYLLNNTNAVPAGVGVDGSGNVWVVNTNGPTGVIGGSAVQEFVGAGVPVVTPISVATKNNALATKP